MPQESNPNAAVNELMIEHAERLWKAESENAVRLSAKISYFTSFLVALFGLGLFKIEWYRPENSVARVADVGDENLIRCFLIVAIVGFGCALMILSIGTGRKSDSVDNNDEDASRKKDAVVHSSGHLAFPEDHVNAYLAGPIDEEFARRMAFALTYYAAIDLQGRNAKVANKIELAKVPFLFGVVFVFLSLLCYTYLAERVNPMNKTTTSTSTSAFSNIAASPAAAAAAPPPTPEQVSALKEVWGRMIARSTEARIENAKFANPSGILKFIPTSSD